MGRMRVRVTKWAFDGPEKSSRPVYYGIVEEVGFDNEEPVLNASGTAPLRFCSRKAAECKWTKLVTAWWAEEDRAWANGERCDVCETAATVDEPLTEWYVRYNSAGDMTSSRVRVAHEECGKVNGWEMAK